MEVGGIAKVDLGVSFSIRYHILAKDRGKFLEVKLCMNLSWDIVISCSRGRIPSSLKSGMVWAWNVDFEIRRIAFFCLMNSLFNKVLGAQL